MEFSGDGKDRVILSNNDPSEAKLDFLLHGGGGGGGSSNKKDVGNEVKVDITLRTQLGQAPILMLLFTAADDSGMPDKSSLPDIQAPSLNIVSISIEIRVNGQVSIVDTAGMWEEEYSRALETQKKMERVLEISQDLGTLVEWSLRWLRQRRVERR